MATEDHGQDTVEMLVEVHKSLESIRIMLGILLAIVILGVLGAFAVVLIDNTGTDVEDRFEEIEQQIGG